MRPEFIPKDIFRAYIKPQALNKFFIVGGILPASFIFQQERISKPIRHVENKGSKFYRAIDLVARAKALCLEIKATKEKQILIDIIELEKKKEALQKCINLDSHLLSFLELSKALTGRILLRPEQIVEGSAEYTKRCGVYFLIDNNRIIYVGQSVNIEARMASHARNKNFNRFAFVACEPELLDALESLYIHFLMPELNGNQWFDSGKHAPISISDLLNSTAVNQKEAKYERV